MIDPATYSNLISNRTSKFTPILTLIITLILTPILTLILTEVSRGPQCERESFALAYPKPSLNPKQIIIMSSHFFPHQGTKTARAGVAGRKGSRELATATTKTA